MAPAPPPPRSHAALALLAALTATAGALALAGEGGGPWPAPALWHAAFAVAALPMILAAQAYFVPVLTRSRETPPWLFLLPLAAMAAALGIVSWFLHGSWALRLAAPWLAFASVAAFAAWLASRARGGLGAPHPCLHWYAAALACLALGLAAVGLSPWLPAQAAALRLFHLHANTLGFMGLTAIGTLQVLVPTVMGKPDPLAGVRLRRDLRWSLGGALAIAAGAAWWWPLAALAAATYAWPLVNMLMGFRRQYGRRLLAPGLAAPLLLAAVLGLGGVLVHGVVHGAGGVAGREALPLFVASFLLPLVSGAVTQLLPVWLRPGAQGEWHRLQRARLAAFSRPRAIAFLAGGLVAAAGHPWGYALAAGGALWLLAAMAATLLSR